MGAARVAIPATQPIPAMPESTAGMGEHEHGEYGVGGDSIPVTVEPAADLLAAAPRWSLLGTLSSFGFERFERLTRRLLRVSKAVDGKRRRGP